VDRDEMLGYLQSFRVGVHFIAELMHSHFRKVAGYIVFGLLKMLANDLYLFPFFPNYTIK